jgi:BlaI family transcriptional regulator, penicillinase repressor
MRRPSLTKPELQILEVLWANGACSIREIHEALPAKGRPAYTTVQTVVYRLEKKRALRCVKRISKANIFEATLHVTKLTRRSSTSCSVCLAAVPNRSWHGWSNRDA